MMSIAQLGGKLGWTVERWVDLPAESSLRLRQGLGHGGHGRIADDHHIHIACRLRPPMRERTKQECDLDLRCNGLYCRSQNVCHANRFYDKGAQFLKYRRRRISAVKKLSPHFPALKHSDLGKEFKFPLNRPQGRFGQSGNLTDMKFFIGSAQKKPQDGSTSFAQEDSPDIING
jgi:hypothetical protein